MGREPRRKRRWLRWTAVMLVILLAAAVILGIFLRMRTRDRRLFIRGERYLRVGESVAAIEHFRAALRVNPDYMDARAGIVRALVERKEFRAAAKELAIAEEKGMEAGQAVRLRAHLLSRRADHRIRSVGKLIEPALCDSTMAEEMDPAIEIVGKHVEEMKEGASGYTFLGDLYARKGRILLLKRRLLLREAEVARSLNRSDEAAEKEARAVAVLPAVRTAQTSAMSSYGRAVELDPDLARPRLAIARHLLTRFVPQPARVKATLEPLLDKQPNNAEVRKLLSEAEALAGEYERALEHIRAVRANRPDDPQLMLAEALVLLEQEKWDELEPLSSRLVETGARGAQASYVRGRVLLQAGRYDEAVNFLHNIFTTKMPHWAQARLALAEALEKQGSDEQALSAYEQVISDAEATSITSVKQCADLWETQYKACIVLADAFLTSQPDASAEYARRAFGLFPARSEALAATRAAYEELEREDEIGDLLLIHVAGVGTRYGIDRALEVCRKEMEGAGKAKGRLNVLMARLLRRKGSYREAAVVYEELRREFPDTRAYAHELAGLHVRLGHYAKARAVYEKLVKEDPKDAAALGGLVATMVRQGEMEEVKSLLLKMQGERGSAVVRSLLLNLLMREGRDAEAVALAEAQAKALPRNAAAQLTLAELLWKQDKLSEAKAVYGRALKLAPGNAAAYRVGLLHLQEGKPRDAIAIFQKAQDRFPRSAVPRIHLAVSHQSDGRPGEAVEILERLRKLAPRIRPNPALATVHWLLAVLYAARGDADAAFERSRQVVLNDLGLSEDRQGLLERLAAAKDPLRQHAAASLNRLFVFNRDGALMAMVKELQTLMRLLPGEPLPECWHALVQEGQGKREAALETYRRIIREHPEFVFARVLLAESRARNGEVDEAIGEFQEAVSFASSERAGWIHVRLAKLYEGQDRIDMAIASYRAAAGQRGLAPLAWNNLAWLLATRRNDPASALPVIQQALKLDGSLPQILDTAGWVYYLNNDVEKAVKYLERAKASLPSHPTIRYHLGMAYVKAGRREEAKAELKEALSLSESFPEAGEAARTLESL